MRVFLRSSSCSVRNLCRSSIARELLERQRVDPAEHRQRALGGAQPLLLLLADERHRVRQLGRPLGPRRHRSRPDGTSWSGPYSATSAVGVEAELLERALLELLDAHPLLGAGHLVAVHRVDQLVVLAGQVAQPAADARAAPARGSRAGLLDGARARCGGRAIETSSRASTTATAAPTASAASALADQPLAPRGAPGRGPRARPGRRASSESARPCSARARSSAVRSASRASISPAAGGAGRLGEPLALGRCRAPRRAASSAAGQPRARGRPARRGPGRGPPAASAIARSSRSASPGPTGPGSRTGRAPRPPRPGWRRTRAAWPARRRPAAGPRRAPRSEPGQSKPSRSQRLCASGELVGGLVDRGLDLDQARLAEPSRRRRSGRRAGRPRG